MHNAPSTKARPQDALQSPFGRIRTLLDGHEPGDTICDLSIGEPKHPIPDFVGPILQENLHLFGKYPPIRGTEALRQSIANWAGQRYALKTPLDPDVVLPLNGSRDGLFLAINFALARMQSSGRRAVLMPNPFYQVYAASAALGLADNIFLRTDPENMFLPDLDALETDPALLDRTAVLILCSPANPQGTIASHDYLERALGLARKHGFMLFCDECYSEIYDTSPPPGGLEVALNASGNLDNVLVLNSLSKRSSLPGLRSGFCAGDPAFIEPFATFRNVAAPQVPLPIQAVSTTAWSDEAHVRKNRDLYRAKFDISDRHLAGRFGYNRPEGSFFLWLNMSQYGGGESAAVTLWKRCGVKVVPGAYLSRTDAQGHNPGEDYIRIALVNDQQQTDQALERVVKAFEQ